MTGNKSFLIDYQEVDCGFVAFAKSPKGGKITGKGKIRTKKLDFEDVYFVKELKFNLFSVSQMCDKKNSVLFTETECIVLFPDFKLLDESQVLLKVPRQNNMYSFDLKSVVPSEITAGNQTNKNESIKDNVDAVPTQQYILLPLLYDSLQSSKDIVANDAGKKTIEERKKGYANSTNRDSTVSPSVSAAGQSFTNANDLPTDPFMPDLEDTADLLNTGIFSGAYDDEDVGAEADLNNLETTMNVSPIPTTRIHKDHPKDQIIEYINSATQTRRMTKIFKELAMSPFLYGTIKEEVYMCQPPGFEDPQFPDKVYKNDIIFGSTKKSLCAEFESLMHKKFQISSMGELIFFLGFQVMQRDDGIFISKDKFQFTLKSSNLHVVKRIFRYLKGQPKLGLWYPRDSPFNLEAFSDSDYAGASLDKKSTTRGIQNQMLDYGFNFMNTKIYIDNESTICIMKNLVFYSKTKNIEIRHHFIRDSYEKKLIQVIKIHIDHNVTDLLTKAFDVSMKANRTTGISQYSGPIPLVTDETIIKEWEDRMEKATTTASSLKAEQDSGNTNRTQSMQHLMSLFPSGTDVERMQLKQNWYLLVPDSTSRMESLHCVDSVTLYREILKFVLEKKKKFMWRFLKDIQRGDDVAYGMEDRFALCRM
ncbi:hypothetical protein Tco_1123247 [Tanacetum coccineum]|uniref:Retrovirus-related Pol polyprotein from transposon TNT 1-94-like beta-barrel domain-containing protein n=1 Tax=Tanacetum coccineum TaxID=301880 RepID=A0ABQ5J2T5_9ASTR